ncbi:hypothetical protein Syun_022933 [Stephania yunnanensis]|uniref:Uncharacterized protein n=1 Tax=Stephania yunnanensis TaxID=152371 RepID=A0AAP0FG20_9MAGN
MSSTSRDWMYNRLDNGFVRIEFAAKVKEFISFAKQHCPTYQSERKIRCSCNYKKCRLVPYLDVETVEYHICRYGFVSGYHCWYEHGENGDEGPQNFYQMDNHVDDADVGGDDRQLTVRCYTTWQVQFSIGIAWKNHLTRQLYDMIEASSEQLWSGCETMTTLSAMARLLAIKSEDHISERGYNEIIKFMKDCLPNDNSLVTSKKDQAQYWADNSRPYKFLSVQDISDAFKNSVYGNQVGSSLYVPYDETKSHPSILSKDEFALSKWELFKTCFAREALLINRNRFLYVFRTCQVAFVGFVTCTMFLRTRSSQRDEANANLDLACLFFGSIHMVFNGFSRFVYHDLSLPVFYKQRDNHFHPALGLVNSYLDIAGALLNHRSHCLVMCCILHSWLCAECWESVALSVGDWFFDRVGVSAIDCPYPCDNTCHNLVSK